jgi:RNA polymerase sigma-70 factor (ECF subfamily)
LEAFPNRIQVSGCIYGVDLAAEEWTLDGTEGAEAVLNNSDFAVWVAPHLSALSAIVVRQVGYDNAADVVQDALLRAWRRRDTYSADRGSPRAWLIALLLDQARRHRLRHLRLATPAPIIDAAVAVEDDDRVDIERALATLSRRQREVAILFYLADLSVADVATVLGIGVGSVKSHLSAARDHLRCALEEL